MVVIIGLEGSANKIGIGIIRDGEVRLHFLALQNIFWVNLKLFILCTDSLHKDFIHS